jgi:hypothetical protein
MQVARRRSFHAKPFTQGAQVGELAGLLRAFRGDLQEPAAADGTPRAAGATPRPGPAGSG